jgi:hypothetical protein
MSDWSFRDSLKKTRLLVDGIDTNPWQLKIKLEPCAESSLDAVMEIGNVLLFHELEEAQVLVSRSGLVSFVREDIEKNPAALEAYLGIVRHSRFPIQRGFVARLLGRSAPERNVVWEWRRVRSVEAGDDSIRILGQVVGST